jgi:hypothetical protein
MTPASQLPNRGDQPDPLIGLQALASRSQMNGPTADDMSEGVLEGLRQVLSITTTAARSVPALADKMRDVRQAVMEAMLTVQNMTEQGNGQGGY